MDKFAECKELFSSNSSFNLCECLNKYTGEIDYFSLYYFNYCVVNNRPWLTWPILIIILLLCFYFISTTGNDYLAETLGIISEKLKLSQNLAGLTLLALGNTAPDVAVAIVSGEGSDQGLTYSLSSVLGGGSMVFGFVLSTVIFLGKEVSVSGLSFIRDLMTYLIIVLFVFIIGVTYKKMNIFIAVAIFGLYVLYVVICIFMESKFKEKNDTTGELSLGIDDDNSSNSDEDEEKEKFKLEIFNDEEKENNEQKEEKNDSKVKDNNLKEKLIKENNQDEKKEIVAADKGNENKEKDEENVNNEDLQFFLGKGQKITGFRAINMIKENEKKFNLNEIMDATYYGKIFEQNENIYRSYNKELAKKNSNKYNYALVRYYYLTKTTKWSDKTIFQKIVYVLIDYTFDLLRNLSIPPFDKKRYNKIIFICLPITIPLFITIFFKNKLFPFYTTSPGCWIILSYYIIAIGIAVILNFTLYRTNLPKCEWILLLASLIMSMLWVMVVCNILIQMIDDAKLLLPFEVNESFLAMTILAVGNSVPDFIVNCSLAKTGYAEMALSGCVGAPIFGMSVGFGLSLIIRFLKSDEITQAEEFNLVDGKIISNVILCAIIGIVLNLLQNIIVGFIKKFKIKRYSSYIGFSIFFLYIIGITIVSFVIKGE